MLNVKFGRWKNFSPQAMDIALGNYGRTPGPIDKAVLAIAEKNTGKTRRENRVADGMEPRMPALRAQLKEKGLPSNDEACVLFAMFPREYENLLSPAKAPAASPAAAASAAPAAKPPVAAGTTFMRLNIQGKTSDVLIEEL
jgi:oxaloacetate decarboxylase alpha subunit/pyruvate carboxylase subunit B